MQRRQLSNKQADWLHSHFITTLGDTSRSGSYLLRIELSDPVSLPFGRFRRGAPIAMPAGTCLYVGSAMNGLAKRLVRHATRSANKPPHAIRAHMLDLFPEIGLCQSDLMPRQIKRLHWHVDHLLDRGEVQLTHVYLLRSSKRLESALARFLERDPQTFIIEKGLGAGDSPTNTHLLGVKSGDAWWQALTHQLKTRFC